MPVTSYFQTSSKDIIFSVSLPPFQLPILPGISSSTRADSSKTWRYISHLLTYLKSVDKFKEGTVHSINVLTSVDVFEQQCCHIDCYKLSDCKKTFAQQCQRPPVECATGTSCSLVNCVNLIINQQS